MKFFILVRGSLLSLSLSLAACAPSSPSQLSLDGQTGIIAGQMVSDSDPLTKSVVSIQSVYTGGSEPRCTGTLIRKRVILTSAHCFYDVTPGARVVARPAEKLGVVFGANAQFVDPSRLLKVANYLTLPGFNPDILLCRSENQMSSPPAVCKETKGTATDLGLLFLVDDAPAGSRPLPIARNLAYETMSIDLVGFGFHRDFFAFKKDPKRLQYTGILYHHAKDISFGSSMMNLNPAGAKFTDGTLGIHFDHEDFMSRRVHMEVGDSGGPMLQVENGGKGKKSPRLLVYGVFSSTGPAVVEGYRKSLSFYTRTAPNAEWIDSTLAAIPPEWRR